MNETKDINKLSRSDLIRCIPYWSLYLACGFVFFTGVSTPALFLCLISYLIRMFAITGFYHRYFSHKTFKTGRVCQFFFAFLGAASGQRGPLWWAAHHRFHHRSSDRQGDVHSPVQHSFLWSHLFWFVADKNFVTHTDRVKDFARYPELKWLDRFDLIPPFLYALFILACGYLIEFFVNDPGVTAGQCLIWGFFISTILVHQFTFSVNSLAHIFGTRPFKTRDNSRNNAFVAFFTLGEGWHNNHHFYPSSTRQGFTLWQFDPTWWGLLLLEKAGLVSELSPVPAHILAKRVSK